MSLRRRVLFGIAAVAAVLVLTNLALASTFQSFLLDRVDRQLEEVATRPFFRPGRDGARPLPPEQQTALTEFFIAYAHPQTRQLTRYGAAFEPDDRPPPTLEVAKIAAHHASGRPWTVDAEDGSGQWRLIATRTSLSQVTVVGIELDEFDATVARIRGVQAVSSAAVLAALLLVTWWVLRLGVDPLVGMTKTADAIAGGDLDRRVEHTDERTEAGRLGLALNTMLERIQEAFRAREASEARVRQFAADASHELRTPLTSIQGYAELWRAGGLRDGDELGEAMRRIEGEGKRMAALVEDLLLLARLDQKRPLDRSLVRLDDLVADAVRDANAVEPDRPIEVDVQPVEVDGDEMRLRQVVGNLLANARVHTPASTPVAVRVAANGTTARLVVEDRGPGMAPDVAARVFERFFRADPSRGRARSSTSGSGLGLSIVSAIAEAHGGRAWVESERGAGSRFTVELPLRRAA
ncbi:MAG TPA: HAMP domain-containing sensor histidine kinase [Acidimicrobiales bacterium]